MSFRLVIDGNAVYEIDEDCEKCREREQCGGFFASTFHHTKYKVRVQ